MNSPPSLQSRQRQPWHYTRSRNLEPAFYAICVVELLNEIYRAIIAVYTTRTYVRTYILELRITNYGYDGWIMASEGRALARQASGRESGDRGMKIMESS